MKARTARVLGALLVSSSVGGALAQLTGGCQQSPVVAPVRSLEKSGKVSFVCLAPLEPYERPLSECTAQQFTSICQYETEDDAGVPDAAVTYNDAGVPSVVFAPHLYALVTQTIRGEVAVVDTSAMTGGVLNLNPQEPGANFLPIGQLPSGIASTPGSVATFVGVGEVGRAGIYAIPSSKIRPSSSFGYPDTCIGGGDDGGTPILAPTLTSWAACALPTPPGDILLIDDPADPTTGNQRQTCDSPYSLIPGDPTLDPGRNAIFLKEQRSFRPKLVMTLPAFGGIAVMDADWLLGQPAGSFNACQIERWVPLNVDLEGLDDQPVPPSGVACTNPKPGVPSLNQPGAPGCADAGPDAGTCAYEAHPGGISYADGKLYVADLGAPIIHVIDMHTPDGTATPCHPVEQAPLLPTSLDNPERVVFVKKVTAAQDLTPDFKRYLYANDEQDASAMVFDIGPNSTTRRPLQRAHPEYNPFQPRDRVKFTAPPNDIVVVERDIPFIDPVSGVAPGGMACNPNPNAVTCTSTGNSCDLGTGYRTSPDYTLGAGPAKLRGEFAYAALSNGKLAVIDIADFDAPCRAPLVGSTLAGCASDATDLSLIRSCPNCTSAEISCNVVSRFEARGANYEGVGSLPGNHVPGIQTFPQLYNNDGSVFSETAQVVPPRMVATLPPDVSATTLPACFQPCDPNACGNTCDTLPGCPLQTFVGGVQTPLDIAPAHCSTSCEPDGAPCKSNSECCPDTGGSVCTNGVCGPATCDNTGAACNPATQSDCTAMNCAKVSVPTRGKAFTPGGMGSNNSLVMNLEDPRAQLVDQNWTVTFEGALPGFNQRIAYLTLNGSAKGTLTDPFSRFCDAGVLGQNAVAWMLTEQPKPGYDPVKLADYVQITNDLPNPVDPYWTQGMQRPGTTAAPPPVCGDPTDPTTCECVPDPKNPAACACGNAADPSTCFCKQPGACTPVSCDYSTCLSTFGTIDVPALDPRRDMIIVEAFQDHVDVVPRNGEDLRLLKCCFPTALTFAVRPGNQWAVVGDQVQFLHHVVASDANMPNAPIGACRNSCDGTKVRLNGRLVETAPALDPAAVPDRAPGTIDPSGSFQNPMFRFAVLSGKQKCTLDSDCPGKSACDQGLCATKVSDTTACPKGNPMGSECAAGSLCDNLSCHADGDCVSASCSRKACTQAADCGGTPCGSDGKCSVGACQPVCFHYGQPVTAATPRDSVFKFSTNGSFVPLLVSLSSDPSALVEPQSIVYSKSTAELAVTDGSFSGLIFVSLTTPGVSRSFF